jgi:hypothetical protein
LVIVYPILKRKKKLLIINKKTIDVEQSKSYNNT